MLHYFAAILVTWGLRDYQTEGQIGLESTPEEYIEKMVGVFREVRRVLRRDGTVFLNMGDSYFGANWRGSEAIGTKQATNRGANASQHSMNPQQWRGMEHGTLKPKDLCGIPWRLALALQADGWWLRSDIVWSKVNPMPESVTDRPTRSHEYVFLLTKAARYFYDADAVREPAEYGRREWSTQQFKGGDLRVGHGKDGGSVTGGDGSSGRNLRTVWTIATESFPDAHFATFPTKLVAPCLKAGCPHKVCAECGSPWVREVENRTPPWDDTRTPGEHTATSETKVSGPKMQAWLNANPRRTLGFLPTCECHPSGLVPVDMMRTRPGIVIDPFMGSGTVGVMAERHQRRWAGCDISAEYAAMATERIERERAQLHLPLEV